MAYLIKRLSFSLVGSSQSSFSVSFFQFSLEDILGNKILQESLEICVVYNYAPAFLAHTAAVNLSALLVAIQPQASALSF